MIIRTETQKDYDEIYHLVRDAFKTAQVSDGKEQDFVVKLRQEADYLADLAFVAEEDGRIIAHIMLTKQKVWTSSGFFEALLLAPLCVAFDYRNRGIGAELVRYAMKVATEKGYKAVFLVGNPDYYGRFGFIEALRYGIRNTNGIPAQYVLAAELEKGALFGVSGQITFAE